MGKSHKQKYGHRMKSEVVEGSVMNTTYGGDNAFGICYYSVRCKICGRTESRKDYM